MKHPPSYQDIRVFQQRGISSVKYSNTERYSLQTFFDLKGDIIMNYKELIMELVANATDVEMLELIYRFCNKTLKAGVNNE